MIWGHLVLNFVYYPQYEIDAGFLAGNAECRTMLDLYVERACERSCRHNGYWTTDVLWLMPLVLWYIENGTTIYLLELKPHGAVTAGD
jgi:hypothetical protein